MAPQLNCPICHRSTIKPLFEDLGITIDAYGKRTRVGGLSTFMCTVENHIFFLRTSDLTPEYAPEAMGDTAAKQRKLAEEMRNTAKEMTDAARAQRKCQPEDDLRQ